MKKKFVQYIIIGIFLIFGLNRCSVACNRANKIDMQQQEIVDLTNQSQYNVDSLRSIIIDLQTENAVLKADTSMLRQANQAMERNNERLARKKEVHYHYNE